LAGAVRKPENPVLYWFGELEPHHDQARTPYSVLPPSQGTRPCRSHDRKDVYLGTFNSAESHERYHRLIAELIARRQQPSNPSPSESLDSANSSRLLVNDLILAFWHHADRYYRRHDGTPTTELAEYRRTLGLLRDRYGRTYCDEFGPKALKAVRAWMIQCSWSRGVVNQRIGRIKRMFNGASRTSLFRRQRTRV